MSRPPELAYRPRVELTGWHSARGPIPGVLITIPANGAALFVSAEHLRHLADALHDTADQLDSTEADQ